jgi:hypothetical protein
MLALLQERSRSELNGDSHRLYGATRPLAKLLRQLSDVVVALSDARYTQKPVGVVESSVGAHVRHCLDHVRALLQAIDTGRLDYDSRRRGTAVESSRCSAVAEIDELIAELRALPAEVVDRALVMSSLMTCDGEPICIRTTVGRELAFTLSHTIHHNALVGAMVKTLGGWLPERFGYAPSTVRHTSSQRQGQGAATCAR